MLHSPEYTIIQTKDRTHIESCARMMSATDPWLRYGMDYEQCLKSFEGDFREIYILQIRESVIAFAVLQMLGTFKGYIQTLCVDEKFRGQGHGTKLLQFCEERILKVSRNIFICVSEFNHGAIKIYEGFGFELVGSLHDFLKQGFSELLYRKTVGPIIG